MVLGATGFRAVIRACLEGRSHPGKCLVAVGIGVAKARLLDRPINLLEGRRRRFDTAAANELVVIGKLSISLLKEMPLRDTGGSLFRDPRASQRLPLVGG